MSTQDTTADLDRAQERVRQEHKRQERTNGDEKKERREPTPYTVLERDPEDQSLWRSLGEFPGRKDLDAIKAAVGDGDPTGRTFVALPRFTPRQPERKVVERTLWS